MLIGRMRIEKRRKSNSNEINKARRVSFCIFNKGKEKV